MASSPIASIEDRLKHLLEDDPWLIPYRRQLERRLAHGQAMRRKLIGQGGELADLARSHRELGLHAATEGWVLREWAPNASAVFLVGDFSEWQPRPAYAFQRQDGASGVWELRLPWERLNHGQLYRLHLQWAGGSGDRIPAYACRVVQDPATQIFNAQVWAPAVPYRWQCAHPPEPCDPVLVYEAHVGMAQEREGIGTYREFADHILPRIQRAGYNTIQLMAVQEHPYYASFGYQVSSFFAASSRFGTPEDLKYLVDTAHTLGLRVVMDLVHSHGVANEVEGLSRFDGTLYQYFHDGPRGRHVAWDSRCFDYGKLEVLQFLLANCAFWLEEYRFDGFRFDGVTSMLYQDHGLERAFTSYADYFNENVDEDAIAYLKLANELIHTYWPAAVTIAEDISGLPGLARSVNQGGVGFDYRFAMGIPDYWIKLTKDMPDESWPMGTLWHELTNRRADEKSISYAECHDQALVGDQTLIFRMAGASIYSRMHRDHADLAIDRAVALHKLIRLITLATAGCGYLNFMGNEFGHPEWIDFPREGNHWSYRYARRQWHLVDHPDLTYQYLAAFDRAMLRLAKTHKLFADAWPRLIHLHEADKIIVFARGGLTFVFHFHPTLSRPNYRFPAAPGKYRLILASDAPEFGGHGRVSPGQEHLTLYQPENPEASHQLSLYLPSRTALVLRKVD
jgi:1,4-alpha-glucan branching enzyme